MSYFAIAATRSDSQWDAAELDLDRVDDVDEVAERLRDVDSRADLSLLFVEADDEYLIVMRLDSGGEPRVFGSDAAFAEESGLGAALLGDLEAVSNIAASDSEGVVLSELDAQPTGEAELLADLGVSASELLGLCAKDGLLPSDVLAEVAARVGCGDVVEEVHNA